MTEKFPEYDALKDLIPNGTVLDGEIIPSIDKKPLPLLYCKHASAEKM
ncbi:MAG: hypothetical protein WDN26_22080 [Chitinophagaceae bacterium]